MVQWIDNYFYNYKNLTKNSRAQCEREKYVNKGERDWVGWRWFEAILLWGDCTGGGRERERRVVGLGERGRVVVLLGIGGLLVVGRNSKLKKFEVAVAVVGWCGSPRTPDTVQDIFGKSRWDQTGRDDTDTLPPVHPEPRDDNWYDHAGCLCSIWDGPHHCPSSPLLPSLRSTSRGRITFSEH